MIDHIIIVFATVLVMEVKLVIGEGFLALGAEDLVGAEWGSFFCGNTMFFICHKIVVFSVYI